MACCCPSGVTWVVLLAFAIIITPRCQLKSPFPKHTAFFPRRNFQNCQFLHLLINPVIFFHTGDISFNLGVWHLPTSYPSGPLNAQVSTLSEWQQIHHFTLVIFQWFSVYLQFSVHSVWTPSLWLEDKCNFLFALFPEWSLLWNK